MLESDSNHRAFHQSTQDQAVVRPKACGERGGGLELSTERFVLSGLVTRSSLLPRESAQKPLATGPFSIKHLWSGTNCLPTQSQHNHSFCFQTSAEILFLSKSLLLNDPSPSDVSADLFQLLLLLTCPCYFISICVRTDCVDCRELSMV